jgi:hypothetical protein
LNVGATSPLLLWVGGGILVVVIAAILIWVAMNWKR